MSELPRGQLDEYGEPTESMPHDLIEYIDSIKDTPMVRGWKRKKKMPDRIFKLLH